MESAKQKWQLKWIRTGVRTVQLRANGCDTQKVTLALTICADGTKLPPVAIFRGKMGTNRVNPIQRELEQHRAALGLDGMALIARENRSAVSLNYVNYACRLVALL